MKLFNKQPNIFSKDYEAGFSSGYQSRSNALKDMWKILEASKLSKKSKYLILVGLIENE